MDCEEFLSSYSDFLDLKIERHSISEYCAHVLGCQSCREYDRVMRRGLRLVRQIDLPEPRSDLVPYVSHRLSAPPLEETSSTRGRLARVLGATALALALIASATLHLRGTPTVQLPPLVVGAEGGPERPSLFGPAPRFRPEVSLLPSPGLTDEGVLVFPSEPLSLFRTPLPSVTSAPVAAAPRAIGPK